LGKHPFLHNSNISVRTKGRLKKQEGCAECLPIVCNGPIRFLPASLNTPASNDIAKEPIKLQSYAQDGLGSVVKIASHQKFRAALSPTRVTSSHFQDRKNGLPNFQYQDREYPLSSYASLARAHGSEI
jgi:hypothetical protein